ncbi:hypothetical protein JDV02_002955 [Purpureocillium takamizusanense]|uniref:Uncharacterized protein n=1 Tax=Purpureocillium takamizusanense TaxID=2060973 RepID=A0A9Q8QC37_9HYPO|nr:uncharacterized protein JDV02_002955 [Purpureocillium takamizusanense]UNI16527.1 hypothetical protein JDV02_002955 [Purpureocillium takamizusanense]
MSPLGNKTSKNNPYGTPTIPGAAGPHVGMGPDAHLPGPAPHTAGPHRHDLLNKLDPTVDSQSGGAQVLGPGVQGTGRQAAVAQPVPPTATAAAGGGMPPGNHAVSGVGGNYTHGPPQHNSRLANTLDPRIDATVANGQVTTAAAAPAPGTAAPGFAPGQNAGALGGVPEGTYGPHRTRAGNALDPTVDSDLDRTPRGMAQQGGGAYGATGAVAGGGRVRDERLPGPAPHTAGPHRSDLMNKLDPKVNSKMEGVPARQYR